MNEACREFQKDDYFKIDPEPHLLGDMTAISHFPGVQKWWKAIEGCKQAILSEMPPKVFQDLCFEEWAKETTAHPESLLRAMDKYGVDIACFMANLRLELPV